jgi:hypothetical protein
MPHRRMALALSLVLGGTLALGASSEAQAVDGDAVQACINPAGLVRVLADGGTCKKNETPVQWASGGAGGTSTPAAGGLQIVDAGGAPVGHLLDRTLGVVKVGTVPVSVTVDASGIPQSSLTFFYTSIDCTGARLMFMNTTDLLHPGRALGGRLYFPAGPVQGLVARSQHFFNIGQDPEGAAVCVPFTVTSTFGPAQSADLGTLGTPPFRIE